MNHSITREKALQILEEKPSLIKEDGLLTNQIRHFSDQQKSLLEVFKQERHQILDLRKSWSMWILFSILVLLFFDIFVIISIGYGWMNFEGVLIPVFLTESVVKIFGLAYVVVRFLFNSNNEGSTEGPSKALPPSYPSSSPWFSQEHPTPPPLGNSSNTIPPVPPRFSDIQEEPPIYSHPLETRDH